MPIPTGPRDYVSNAEFGRYVADETAYRGRVAQQLEVQYGHITAELGDIKNMVREANGKTNANGMAIAVMQRDLEAIKSEDNAIERTVEDIRTKGCAQLESHQQVLTQLGWSPQKKAAVAGGLVGTGAIIWPALQEIAKLVHAVIERTP
jgi:hypothetical protein